MSTVSLCGHSVCSMYTHQGESTCILKLSTDTAIRNSHQQHKSYLHCKIFALMLPHQNCRWVWNTLAKIKKKSFKFLLKLSYQTKVFQNIGFTPTWVAPIPYLTSFKNSPAKKWYALSSIRPVTEIIVFIRHRSTKHQSWKFH